MVTEREASSDSGDETIISEALRRSPRETLGLAGPSNTTDAPEVVVFIDGESTEELFGEGADVGDQEEEKANSGEEARKGGKQEAARCVVRDAKKVAIKGKVSSTSCILDQSDLNDMMFRFGRLEGVMLRLPAIDEVAYSDMSPEVCLYEHMFIWGLRLLMEEKPRGQLYIAVMCGYYGISPRQISANSFAYLAGFWAFMYQCMGERTPLSKGPFSYFFEIREQSKEGRYYFSLRHAKSMIRGFDKDTMGKLRRLVPVTDKPSNQKLYQNRFMFATIGDNPF